MNVLKKVLVGVFFALLLCSTNKVYAGDEVISEAGQYLNVDYGFLKSFAFGDEKVAEVQLTFDSADKLMVSTDARLSKPGRYVSTKGYHKAGDGGALCYVISATEEIGGIKLTNGLYANPVVDTQVISGVKWAVISIKQLGAYGDGSHADDKAINDAINVAGKAVGQNGVARAMVYIPKGGYKATDELHMEYGKINIIGEGDGSVIFTDNDYRKDKDYYEFFFMIQGVSDVFLSNFKIDAREVDVYQYMRQVVLTDCNNVYIHKVNMIVPQEAWSGFYYEDKQYTNLTLYSGNRNITVDGCYMEQMSGTYRGANLGVLDFWQRGEENITIMNCEFHSNARDEQIGIFPLSKSTGSYIKNVDFINNKMYSYKPPYRDLYGNRQMCFTLAYNDSQNVNDVRLAGNHFIAEVDSKFATFGNIKNCVIENNIFEIRASYGVFGMIFDSSARDVSDVIIRNNEFYLTGRDDSEQGKAIMSTGKLTFTNNRVVVDSKLYAIGGDRGIFTDNEIIGINGLGTTGESVKFDNNKITAYNSFDGFSKYTNLNLAGLVYTCNNNKVINYTYFNGENTGVFTALTSIADSTLGTYEFCGNTYTCPNFRYTNQIGNIKPYKYLIYFKQNTGKIDNVIIRNNNVMGSKEIITWGNTGISNVVVENNTFVPFSYEGTAREAKSIDITQNGVKVNDITVYGDSVNLSALTTTDIDWVSSLNSVATVNNGTVKRVKYGTVYIYAVAKDGVSGHAVCRVRFAEAKATDIYLEHNSIVMQPGYTHDVSYKVLPFDSAARELAWTSSNPAVARVDKYGVIEAVAEGSAIITCKTQDGTYISKTISVKVEKTTVKKIELNHTWKYFESPSGTIQLSVNDYIPNNAVNKSVGKWESSDNTIASVSSTGLVTIKGPGVATVRAYTTDYKYYGECVILVKPKMITSLKADAVGKNYVSLSWEESPNVYGYNVYRYNTSTGVWNKVTTTTSTTYRDNNLIPGVSYKYSVKGYIANWVTGTRTEYEGDDSNILSLSTYTFQPVESIGSLPEYVSVAMGEMSGLSAKPYPLNADNRELIWSVKDSTVATVEYVTSSDTLNVRVKPLKPGVTTLTVRAKDSVGYSVTIPLIVIEAPRPEKPVIEPGYKDMTIKWKPVNENEIDGYVILRTTSVVHSPIKYIPLDELRNSGEGYIYNDMGLAQNVNYSYKIATYIQYDDKYCIGPMSGDVKAKLLPYTDVEGINAEEVYIVSQGQKLDISVSVDTGKGMVPDFIWQIDDESIATVKGLSDKTTRDSAYATLKGVKTGITRLSIIANDATGYFIMPKVVVLPSDVEGVSGTATTSELTFTWNEVAGADGYVAKLYKKDTGELVDISIVRGENTVFSELKADTKYRCVISAYIEDSEARYEGYGKGFELITKDNTVIVPEPDREEPVVSPDKPAVDGEKPVVSPDNPPSEEEKTIVSPDNPTSEDEKTSETDKDVGNIENNSSGQNYNTSEEVVTDEIGETSENMLPDESDTYPDCEEREEDDRSPGFMYMGIILGVLTLYIIIVLIVKKKQSRNSESE